MGDCSAGPAFAIWISNYKVQGHVEVMDGIPFTDYVIEGDTVGEPIRK